MPIRYVHLSGKGLDEDLLDMAGIKKKEPKESPLKAKICYRPSCNHENLPDAKYCEKCNFVLSVEGFEEVNANEVKIQEDMKKMWDEIRKDRQSIQESVAEFKRIKDFLFLHIPESVGKPQIIREVEQTLKVIDNTSKYRDKDH
jgi:hypothetical protein